MGLSPGNLADIVLNRREVYSLDLDSRIRHAANRMSARALFEILGQTSAEPSDLAEQLSSILDEFGQEPTYCIAFETGTMPAADHGSKNGMAKNGEPVEFFLRLVFQNEEAAYYQFPIFPRLDVDSVLGAARKRAGAIQYLCVEFTRLDALQSFIESCHANPHLLRVERSTAEEFQNAPSHAV